MKAKLKLLLLMSTVSLLILVAYGLGFYRGYQDRSRISSSFDLACDEAFYDEIRAGKLDSAASGLQVKIYGEDENLKTMAKSSFKNFANEFSRATSGNIPNQIQKADEITKGLTFSPFRPTDGK